MRACLVTDLCVWRGSTMKRTKRKALFGQGQQPLCGLVSRFNGAGVERAGRRCQGCQAYICTYSRTHGGRLTSSAVRLSSQKMVLLCDSPRMQVLLAVQTKGMA